MNKTILLVEDDANDIFFMRRAAQQAGVIAPLAVVEDGQEAINYLSGHGKYSDRKEFPLPMLVLLDLKLPRVMGLDVLKWIQTQPDLLNIILVVLTSSRLEPDIETAYRFGASSYLVKPSTPGALPDMVAAIKKYWLEMNQPAPNLL